MVGSLAGGVKSIGAAKPVVDVDEVAMTYHEYDPYLLFRGIPHAEGVSDHFGRYRLNSLGFRSPQIGDKRRFRLAVVGGSAVWGSGASDNSTTFPAQIADLAPERAGREIEAINAGCGSYVSFQELVLLAHKLVYLNLDAVLVFDGYNDVHLGARVPEEEFEANENENYRTLKDFLVRRTASIDEEPIAVVRELRDAIGRLGRLGSRGSQPRPAHVGKPYAFNLKAIRAYLTNVEMMCDLLRGHGVEVLLALQPYLPLSKKALTAPEQEILEAERQKPAKVEVVTAAFGMLEEELARVAAAKGVSFRSFVGVFDDEDETCFYDMVHPNDHGYRKVAEVATEWLAERVPVVAA